MLWAGALWIALTWGLLLGHVLGDGVEQKEAEWPVDGSMSFRLGSGAVATSYSDLTKNVLAPPKLTLLKSKRTSAGETFSPTPVNHYSAIPIYKKMNQSFVKLI